MLEMVNIWQSYREFKGENFLRRIEYIHYNLINVTAYQKYLLCSQPHMQHLYNCGISNHNWTWTASAVPDIHTCVCNCCSQWLVTHKHRWHCSKQCLKADIDHDKLQVSGSHAMLAAHCLPALDCICDTVPRTTLYNSVATSDTRTHKHSISENSTTCVAIIQDHTVQDSVFIILDNITSHHRCKIHIYSTICRKQRSYVYKAITGHYCLKVFGLKICFLMSNSNRMYSESQDVSKPRLNESQTGVQCSVHKQSEALKSEHDSSECDLLGYWQTMWMSQCYFITVFFGAHTGKLQMWDKPCRWNILVKIEIICKWLITCSTVVLQCYRRQAIPMSKPKFDPP